MRWLVVALLLTGCAGIRAVTPYTTDETEQERAACLAVGGAWLETQTQYQCARPPAKERT